MGEAMASGWVSSGLVDSARLCIVEPGDSRREDLAGLGMRTVATASESLPADIVVLAVKPQVIDDVVAGIRDLVGTGLVVSVAAGVSTGRLESLLPHGVAVVRVMPNTPAMVGEGMAVVSGGRSATREDVETVVAMFSALGQAAAVDEDFQNAATAISGSGPAYFALVVDALAQAGMRVGLEEALALQLAVQTMRGTSGLLGEGGMEPRALIEAVSSPGGTTVAALGELQKADISGAFDLAVRAAVARAEELGAGK
jgi:pyrroline-5-carboxylate reductase